MRRNIAAAFIIAAQCCAAQDGSRNWSLDIGTGWSHRTAPVEDIASGQLEEYARGLVNGWHVKAGVDRTIGNGIALGIGVDHARWRNAASDIALTDVYGESGSFALEDRISTTFIGAGIRMRHGSSAGSVLFDTDVDLGFAAYHHVTLVGDEKLTLNGGNLALRLRVGLDVGLSERTSLLFGMSYLYSRVRELNIDDREGSRWLVLHERELSLNRLDLSAGIRFRI